MDDSEARLVEDRLREIARGHRLEWALEQSDETFDAGILEPREIRSQTTNGVMVYSEVSEPKKIKGRRRPEEFVTQRDHTPSERVAVLTAAIARAAVEGPSLAESTLERLNDGSSEGAQVDSVTFVTDTDEVVVSINDDRPRSDHSRLSSALVELARS